MTLPASRPGSQEIAAGRQVANRLAGTPSSSKHEVDLPARRPTDSSWLSTSFCLLSGVLFVLVVIGRVPFHIHSAFTDAPETQDSEPTAYLDGHFEADQIFR